MNITPNLINELEKMSGFDLDENEKSCIESEISQMLDFVNEIKSIKISSESDTQNNVTLDSFVRTDEVKCSCDVCDALSNAMNKSDNFFVVPKVVD